MADDYLRELGISALGSRLKRLTERLNLGVAETYAASALRLEPGWMALFRLIQARGAVSVGEASAALGVTHPTVVQAAQAMTAAGLVQTEGHPGDRRRRILRLTATGQRTFAGAQPTWAAVDRAARELQRECGVELAVALDRLEDALAQRPYAERIAAAKETP